MFERYPIYERHSDVHNNHVRSAKIAWSSAISNRELFPCTDTLSISVLLQRFPFVGIVTLEEGSCKLQLGKSLVYWRRRLDCSEATTESTLHGMLLWKKLVQDHVSGALLSCLYSYL
jgi:hypothetical protein